MGLLLTAVVAEEVPKIGKVEMEEARLVVLLAWLLLAGLHHLDLHGIALHYPTINGNGDTRDGVRTLAGAGKHVCISILRALLSTSVRNGNRRTRPHARSTDKLEFPEISVQDRAFLRGGHGILELLVHNDFRRRFGRTNHFVLCMHIARCAEYKQRDKQKDITFHIHKIHGLPNAKTVPLLCDL